MLNTKFLSDSITFNELVDLVRSKANISDLNLKVDSSTFNVALSEKANLADLNTKAGISDITAASNLLQTNIDSLRNSLQAEVDRATATEGSIVTLVGTAQTAANNALSAIYTETVNRATADTALSNRLDVVVASVSGNTALIATESTTRANQDSAIALQISNITTQVNGNIAAIQSEALARSDADSAISRRIDTVVTTVNNNTAAIQSESTARSDAVSALATRVDTVVTTVDTDRANSTASITSEAIARADGDGALSSRIDNVESTFNTSISNNTARISTEETTRANADSALSSRVDTLTATVNTDRSNVNASITSEATTRANADSALTTRIDNATSSLNSDISAVTVRISTEELTRATQDSALSSRIDNAVSTFNTSISNNTARISTEETTRANADSALSSRVDTLTTQTTNDKNTLFSLIQTEQTTRSDAISALATRTTNIEATLAYSSSSASDNAVAINARINDEITARVNADNALTTRIDNATSSFSTGLQTVTSRIATEETTRATADSALANRATVLESGVSTLGIVQNNKFLYWPNGNTLPSSWTIWSGTAENFIKDQGTNGNGLIITNLGPSIDVGIYQNIVAGPGTYNLSVTVKRQQNTWNGAGVLIYYFSDSNFSTLIGADLIDFIADADSADQTGEIDPTGTLVRQFDKTITAPANTQGIRVYLMGQWIGFQRGSYSKAVTFYGIDLVRSGITRQTNARISTEETTRATQDSALSSRIDNVVSTFNTAFSNNSARITTEETTRANADSALSTQISTVNSRFLGARGLTPNADFSNGFDGWAPQSFQLVSYGTGSKKFNAAVSPYGSATQLAGTNLIKIDDWTRGFKLNVVFEVRGAAGIAYCGIACYDIDNNYLGNIYIPSVIGQTFAPADGFNAYRYSFVFQGINYSLPVPYYGGSPGFIPSTYFVTPLFIANYTSVASCQMQVNSLSLEDAGAAQLVDSKVETEITTRANADSALSSRIDTVSATAGSLSAAVQVNSSAIADVNNKLAAAAWTVQSVTSGGRAAITVRSSTNNGAGVDIVGDVNFAGNLNIGANLTGERQVITNQLTRIYDVNNVLRFRQGIW